MKVYTKQGDGGYSSTLGGKKSLKSSDVFDVLGSLDELSACLGFLNVSRIKDISTLTKKIQNDLFTIGAYIASEKTLSAEKEKFLALKTEDLEQQIDKYSAKLPELKNFILPGGSPAASHFHTGRAVCRRLERILVEYYFNNPEIKSDSLLKYINRLSDFLFVLARYVNQKLGVQEVIWNGDDQKI